MIPAIDYISPETLDDALAVLAKNHGEAAILSGGTDIVANLHQGSRRLAGIKKLIDIGGLSELKLIEGDGAWLRIGAGVTFSEVMKSPLIQRQFPLLAKAAATVGSVQIRNRATIGGNCCNNAPCADSVPPLLVYDARLRLVAWNRERTVSLSQFLVKPYRTQLAPDELVVAILLPLLPDGYRGDFYKLGRRRGVAISRITLALLMKIVEGTIQDIRIASGAVTPIGMRFPELEEQARGKPIGFELCKILAQQLGQLVLDKTGLRWSTPYKLPVVQQVFYQTIAKLCNP